MSLVTGLSSVFSTIAQDIKNLFTKTVPIGGTTGQVLIKNSSTDGDYSWQTVTGVSNVPVFVQETDPSAPSPYIWFKTNIDGKVIDILKG